MLFWIIAAALTIAASFMVLLPLTRGSGAPEAENAHDIEVYRDQLSELDRDAARGLIGPADAEEARAEVARRILKAASPPGAAKRWNPSAARAMGAAAVLAVPLISWGLYEQLGSPALPGQPLSARLAEDPAKVSMDDLVARSEGYLVSHPEDGRGWDVLAPIYQRAGRLEDAIAAYRNAIRLLGPSVARLSGIGEALAYVAGGRVTPEARASFQQALALDGKDARAQFYLAAGLAQQQKLAEAASAWRAMAAELPADDPWRNAAERAVAAAERMLAGPMTSAVEGPDQGDVDAAVAMPDGDRKAMIESMVAGLDARLRENPRDPEGWLRLVRSYSVIGRSDAARDALDRGLQALGGDRAAAGQLQALAAALGIDATRKE